MNQTIATPLPAGYLVQVFYDGQCPLCRREIRLLQKLDRRHRILFTNIADPSFDPASYAGRTMDDFMQEIQGRSSDGGWISGVEVFRQLYSAVGAGPLVWVTRWPGIAQLLQWGYVHFARNRLRWTGRCNDSCHIPS
jgi:predicted DCC family thiol-disulfide oxidoreductase YuxK